MLDYREMRLEVALHDGIHTAPSSGRPTAIVKRHNHTAHNGVALWEITLTLKIRGPESWWKQAHKYFPEIVWLRNRPDIDDETRQLTADDFEDAIPQSVIAHLNNLSATGNREALRLQLPNSFIRTGLAHTTMATLTQIDRERRHYSSGHWLEFCERLHEIPEIVSILDRRDN